MGVNWADLGQVFLGTLVAAVLVVGLFAAGVVGLSRQAALRERGASAAIPTTGAVLCFALCVVIVGYGIFLIIGH
jgi:hypothetical protein